MYLQYLVLVNHYCYLPLLWKIWNWFECGVGIVLIYFGAVVTVECGVGIILICFGAVVTVECGVGITLIRFGAVVTSPKQISIIPTPHSNQFQFFHNSRR